MSEESTPQGTTEPRPDQSEGGAESQTPRTPRKRGSRGGKNRSRSGNRPATSPSDRAADDRAPGVDRERQPQSWNDASADRGLTSEDLAADAREDAGIPSGGPHARLTTTPPPPPRPKVGDSRPAPTPISDVAPRKASAAADGDATGAPKKRRRRRGGRGRGTQGSGNQGQGGQPAKSERSQSGGLQRRSDSLAPISGNLDPLDDGVNIYDLLDEDEIERRRGSTRKGKPVGRYMMAVHQHEDGKTHLAVLEGRNLVEHYVAEPEDMHTSIDGNIYLGRVQNVLPGMEAAFVDIGTPKNAVLYRSDVSYDKGDMEGNDAPRIERMLKNGQSIIAQVTKNPIAHKGARLTQEVSLAGRFVVLVPGQPDTYGISKRLPDDERKRLRRVLDGLRPVDAGLIVRTAAEGAAPEELEGDVRRLVGQWKQISELASRAKPGTLLYKEPGLVVRLIREEFTKEYRGIVIDDWDLYEEVKSYVEAVAPLLAERVAFYDEEAEGLPILERYHVHEQLTKALDRKVWLPSGGSLIIERTEALTVIDVNTGKNVGSSNLEQTVFDNNLEAAAEIARQLRLRDIGGIIVIDFVDMEIRANRTEVLRAFKEALARDKTRTQVFEISELGLVEMTRKRISEGLVESFSHTCQECDGRGFVIDEAML
ncbi:MAG: Rne/Rng family ribonuclease [Acidimicrobiia bacterium]